MSKRVPEHIISKIERMNSLMQQVVALNYELEHWMEDSGIVDAFAFTLDYRESRGYEIVDPDSLIEAISAELSK